MKTNTLSSTLLSSLVLIVLLLLSPFTPSRASSPSRSQVPSPQLDINGVAQVPPLVPHATRLIPQAIFEIKIKYTLKLKPNTTYDLEFFMVRSPMSCLQFFGGIPFLLGTLVVVTDNQGIAAVDLTVDFPDPVDVSSFIIYGTATDSLGSTIEISSPHGACGEAQNNNFIISGKFTGTPNTAYTIDFFFTPTTQNITESPFTEQTDGDCIGSGHQYIGSLPVTTDAGGNAVYSGTFTRPSGGGGFINGQATSVGSATMTLSACIPVGLASSSVCNYSITKAADVFTLNEGAANITLTTSAECSWKAASTTDWITIDPSYSGTGTGAVSFFLTKNVGIPFRQGQIIFKRDELDLLRYSVIQLGTGPFILGVSKSGKNLLIDGANFANGAVVIAGDVQRKAIDLTVTQLTAKKAAKGLQAGAIIIVRNPDGSESNGWRY